MKAARKRTAAPSQPGAKADRKSAAAEAVSKSANDQRETVIVDGAKAKRRLDRPARKRYADGGNVTDGLQQFRNIERAFASNDDSASAPPLRPLSNDSARLATLPSPVQKSAFVVPTVDPLQSLQRTQQIIAHGLPRGFAKGGKIRSPKGAR